MSIKQFKLKKAAPKVKFVGKKSAASDFQNEVDGLAAEYIQHKDRAKSEQAAADKVNELIKSLVEKKGQPEDKSKMCYGKNFVVGVSETTYSPKLDVDKMEPVLGRDIYLQCVQIVPAPDEAKVKNLVDAGVISKKQFLAILTDERAPVKRLYVSDMRKHMDFKKKKQSNETETD